MKEYYKDGRVTREDIVADIADGTLSKNDIAKLAADERVRNSFIGKAYSAKTSKDKWNRSYLEKMQNVAVAESFNEDYLYYLADVAEYVNSEKTKQKNKTKVGVAIAAAVIVVVGIALILILKANH